MRMLLVPALVAVASLVPLAAVHGATVATGLLVREVRVRGELHHFAVWVPADYTPERAWPCVVFLHGSGECGTDGEKATRVGLPPAAMARPERWPCVIVIPQKPLEEEEWEEREDLVFAALAAVREEFRVDPDRIALTGLSQGGHGAWMIAARHRGVFSCVVPVCGYGRARTIAPRVAELPVWAFHGLKDDVVDPAETRRTVDELRAVRAARGLDPGGVRVTLYPDANHGSWDAAYAEPELPGWMLAQRRPAR